jgi:hypothetical protein
VTAAAVATLVWLAAPPSAPAVPDAEERRAVAAWAQAHGVVLEAPTEGGPPSLSVDPSAADRVEELLDRTRDAMAAGDTPAADVALDRADALLRAHPALPQAAWLMAEVERARSIRWRRLAPSDPAAADRAWSRAESLDRGRVAAVGERAAEPAPPAEVTIDVAPGESARWDGQAADATPWKTRAGAHALVVTWNGAPVWAGWVEIPGGASVVRPAAPSPAPCSSADFAGVELEGAAPRARHVRCERWVVAAAGSSAGAVRIAACEADRCGPMLEWTAAPAWTLPLEPERRRRAWPRWATWALSGAGVAATAGIAAAIAVTVTRPAPSETRFVSGGLKSP